MSFRSVIAGWIWPEAVRNERRYQRLCGQIDDCRYWLAEFPEVGAVTDWLLTNERNYWRREGDPVISCRWYPSIDQFREQLRRGEARPK